MAEGTNGHPQRLSGRIVTLAQLRAERGLSLRQLGTLTGLNSGLLSLMERGLLVPSSSELGRIASALDVSSQAVARVRFEIEWELPA